MLWDQLKLQLPGKSMEVDPASLAKPVLPIYNVEIVEVEETKSETGTLEYLPKPYGALNPTVHLSTVIENERLTSKDHFQDVRHITFGLPEDGFNYQAGDVLMI